MVPVADTVCFMVPVVAATTLVVASIGGSTPLVPSQMPIPAPAATTTATTTEKGRVDAASPDARLGGDRGNLEGHLVGAHWRLDHVGGCHAPR